MLSGDARPTGQRAANTMAIRAAWTHPCPPFLWSTSLSRPPGQSQTSGDPAAPWLMPHPQEGLVAQSCVILCDPRNCNLQDPLSIQFSKQDHWSRLPFPSPGGLPDPGIEHGSPILTGRFFTSEPPGKPPESRDHLSPVWKILSPGDPFSRQSVTSPPPSRALPS